VILGTEDVDADEKVDGTVVEWARGEDTRWCQEHSALDDEVGEEIGHSTIKARKWERLGVTVKGSVEHGRALG
jgi:hypothetical protein